MENNGIDYIEPNIVPIDNTKIKIFNSKTRNSNKNRSSKKEAITAKPIHIENFVVRLLFERIFLNIKYQETLLNIETITYIKNSLSLNFSTIAKKGNTKRPKVLPEILLKNLTAIKSLNFLSLIGTNICRNEDPMDSLSLSLIEALL